jgi:hypothetical protein
VPRSRGRDIGEAVEIFRDGPSLVVQGEPAAVAQFIDQMLETTGNGTVARRNVAGALAIAGHVGAISRTDSSQYVELSPKSLRLLEQKRRIPTQDGYFRGFLRERENANFAGFVDWRPVNIAPQNALSMQTLAVHLALHAAIQDVSDAIERVEGKVNKLVNLARAERLGMVTADRATLENLVHRVRESGQVTATDWSTVDSLGPEILRGIEALRAYVMQEIADLEPTWRARARSSELGELTEDLLRESLALLVIAERNYALWQEIRVANVATRERKDLDHTLRDVRNQLMALSAADQSLVDALQAHATQLLQPHGFEGLTPLAKRKLHGRGAEVETVVNWFADRRHLEAVSLEMAYPSLGDSIGKAVDASVDGFAAAGRWAVKLGKRSSKDPLEDPS